MSQKALNLKPEEIDAASRNATEIGSGVRQQHYPRQRTKADPRDDEGKQRPASEIPELVISSDDASGSEKRRKLFEKRD